MPKVTPMIQQYLLTKEQYKDCILFYRLGDFYEMFFEDAKLASRELDIVLTGRDCGLEERAPMCGVPYHSVDGYIKKLIEKGYKVAICEQTSDPATSKGLVDREVIRVITPGTVIEEDIIDPNTNRYILCLVSKGDSIGLAWCDVSTGEFYLESMKTKQAEMSLLSQINRIAPAEILTDDHTLHKFEELLRNTKLLISTMGDWAFTPSASLSILQSHFHVKTLAGFDLPDKGIDINAAGALMQYLHQTQKNALSHINGMRRARGGETMELDATTRRNLELTASIMGSGRKYTLLGVLDRTKTAQGSRLLRFWIEHPLQQVQRIRKRLDAVNELLDDIALRDDLQDQLDAVYDLERLCSKVSYGTLHARDALAIAKSLRSVPLLKQSLDACSSALVCELKDSLPSLDALADLIESAIIDDPPVNMKDGGIIKCGYNHQVDELKEASTQGRQWLITLEEREKESTGIKNLKVGYNRVFGFYLEVTKSQLDQVPYRYVRKQTLTNSERFITEELKDLEEKILGADEKRIRLEQMLFIELRDTIGGYIDALQAASRAIAQIDALLSLSLAAYEHGYNKPNINQQNVISITDGRHPVVEQTVTGFVPNDVYLNGDDSRFHLITGPNMSGKSTFMRQVAIIALMAHIGSYVPAREADICIIDRIFTRVGASDDLASGRSTFMVEMVELANILNHATKNSLIILDEIGRGTSTYDGLSIAWAASEYICTHFEGAKTLFATHYHELVQLEERLPGVKNYCVLAREMGNDIIFLHRIVRGGTDKSFGIQVAGLAGIPNDVIARAQDLLSELQNQKSHHPFTGVDMADDPDDGAGDDAARALIEELANTEIGQLTPLEALNTINTYKNRAEKLL